jgi:hypothetical protein
MNSHRLARWRESLRAMTRHAPPNFGKGEA